MYDAKTIRRFWAKVDKDGPLVRPELGKCWVWTAFIHPQFGYGHFKAQVAGAWLSLRAHRVSYELANGPIPVTARPHDACVCHSCDTRRCVNPRHLFLGSQRKNNEDRHRKGRTAPGAAMPHAKLTLEKAAEIRNEYTTGGTSHVKLARKYGVGRSTIADVLKGTKWAPDTQNAFHQA